MRKAINIMWDVDKDEGVSREEVLAQLPSEIIIPEDMDDDDIADYLSDQTGYCHFGFGIEDC
jgi:hypothetical protein